jgi:two-component system KDP operon response regulator KdpE
MPNSRASILVIDDESQIHRFLCPALTSAGFDVDAATTGMEGLRILRNRSTEVILLDLGLPDMDGLDAIARIRRLSDAPILVISARNREADKISALDAGANDYIEKPFGIGELLARIRVALRLNTAFSGADIVQFAGLKVDFLARRAHTDGGALTLTPLEWKLLINLVKNAGRVLTHRQLLASVWGHEHIADTQYLRVYMGMLRQKLGPAGALIATEIGVGYRMAEPLSGTTPIA